MKTYGLIGEKLGHSFSKKFFEEKFKRSGIINTCYLNIELNRINELISLLNTKSISGNSIYHYPSNPPRIPVARGCNMQKGTS